MEKILIKKVRDYITSSPCKSLNLFDISKNIGESYADIIKTYPSPNKLAKDLLEHDLKSLESLLAKEVNEEDPAIESIINVSVAIFHEFEIISPEKLIFLKQLFPSIYQRHIELKIELIRQHFNNNITRGIANGEYKSTLNPDSVITKYCDRIIKIHSTNSIESKNYSFGHIFNIIFEDYMEEVATADNWKYFRSRKQLVETLSFGK